jgi:alpha-tubulin suppressor-like RCC1 family protein
MWLPVALWAGCGTGDQGVTPPDDTGPTTDLDRDGFSLAEGDCDDENENVYPGALDVVGDEVDQNCDSVDGLDADGDGHAGTGTGGLDCNDNDRYIYPGAEEIGWDGIDQDCNFADLYDFDEVAAGGDHTCALKSTSEIACWGRDTELQVSNRPVVGGWKHIAAGQNFNCAVNLDGSIYCWGEDDFNQLSAPAGNDWDLIAAGQAFACAINLTGDLQCWGKDEDGQVSEADNSVAMKAVAGGDEQGCALTRDEGRLTCWGGSPNDAIIEDIGPVQSQYNYRSIVVGTLHACVIRLDNGLNCWGENNFDQLSPPFTPGNPSEVGDAGPYSMLSATYDTTCGVVESEFLSCWGKDNQFQVLNAPRTPPNSVRFVSMGHEHGCVIENGTGSVICWGNNASGQTDVPVWD